MSDRSNKNSAVSPVIGTILLVAITVVLIAIITAVVMGLADAEDGKKVGMNAQPDNIETAKAKLILYGGESLSELIKLEMIDHDSPNGVYVELWNGTAGTVSVGVPYTTLEDVARPPKDMKVYETRINVKGTFVDGREIVLLVQPMTFYDVFEVDNTIKPDISLPSVKAVGDTSSLNKTITVTYTNTTSAPSNLVICYQNESGEKLTIECGPGEVVESPLSELFDGERKLPSGIYKIWGEITMNGKTYSGPELTYTVPTISMNYYWANKASPETNSRYYIDVSYSNAPAVPTELVFCYRPASDPEGSEVRKSLGPGNGNTYKFVDTDVMRLLKFNTAYTYWVEATIDGIMYRGINLGAAIHKPGLTVAPVEPSGEKAGTRNISVTYTKAPSDVTKIIVKYYSNRDRATPIETITLDGAWPHYQPTVDTKTTINVGEVTLTQDHYSFEVEIFTLHDGSFKTGITGNYDVTN